MVTWGRLSNSMGFIWAIYRILKWWNPIYESMSDETIQKPFEIGEEDTHLIQIKKKQRP